MRWGIECKSKNRGIEGTSADPGKDQFADAVSAAPVHFNPNQVCLAAQPVDAADTTLPASHNRAALLVRPGDLPLSLASVTQGFPLFGSDASEEGRVNRIEHIQIRNHGPRNGARVGALELLV